MKFTKDHVDEILEGFNRFMFDRFIFEEEEDRLKEFDKMIRFLDMAWIRKDEIVPCLIGPVGIGKTAAVRQHAENVGAKNVVTIIASQILPSEVSGITMPDSKTKSMEIYDHYKLSSLQDGDILFFDELLEADQCVLSACLTLIESRMMMSGKLLPDIQIIAATNPTVNPNNIKENIRQRFMFKEFTIDTEGVRDYIKEVTGIKLNTSALKSVVPTSKEFNILSPRSLTKLCKWMASIEDDSDRMELAGIIDNMFLSRIGHEILESYNESNKPSVDQLVRDRMYELYSEIASDADIVDLGKSCRNINDDKKDQDYCIKDVFQETSMDELLNILKKQSIWEQIENSLKEIQLPDQDQDQEQSTYDREIQF